MINKIKLTKLKKNNQICKQSSENNVTKIEVNKNANELFIKQDKHSKNQRKKVSF